MTAAALVWANIAIGREPDIAEAIELSEPYSAYAKSNPDLPSAEPQDDPTSTGPKSREAGTAGGIAGPP